jgi:hypothetical protein
MAQPIVLNKSVTTSSSGMLGFFSSGTVLYTSGSSAQIGTSSGAVATTLDTGRRIIVWSSAAASESLIITLTGLSDSGDVVTEKLLGSSAAGTLKTTVQDFASVTSVTFSSSLNVRLNLGTSSRAGTPWITTNSWADPFDMAVALTFTATGTASANFECTLEDITQIGTPGPNKLLSSSNPQIVPWYPTPFISQTPGSTFVSTAIDAITTANFTNPISAWRVTLISSSSNAAQLGVSVLQAG